MQSGTVVADKYVIQDTLGTGGFAQVYLASDRQHDRSVALKVMLSADEVHGGTYQQLRKRFFREADYLSRLDEPRIVDLYDYDETGDDRLYMILEFVDGRTLSEIVDAGGNVPPPTALDVLRELLIALREVHDLGLLHRDVKPDNVMVLQQPGGLRAKLLDFGIARTLSTTNTELTGTGKIVGTPRYFAPEQFAGSELSPATDIYGAGLLLYYMLTGRRPYHEANSREILARSVKLDMRPRLRESARISADLAEFMNQLLAPDPRERFQNAKLVLSELERQHDRLVGGLASSSAVTVSEADRAPTVPGSIELPTEETPPDDNRQAPADPEDSEEPRPKHREPTDAPEPDTAESDDAPGASSQSTDGHPDDPPENETTDGDRNAEHTGRRSSAVARLFVGVAALVVLALGASVADVPERLGLVEQQQTEQQPPDEAIRSATELHRETLTEAQRHTESALTTGADRAVEDAADRAAPALIDRATLRAHRDSARAEANIRIREALDEANDNTD